jgi:hypothetical protein
MSADLHVGDVDTNFIAIVKDQDAGYINISAATVRKLIFRKPNGTVVEKVATQLSSYSGTNAAVTAAVAASAAMRYTTLAGDLDVEGEWLIQGYVEVGAGKWHTDVRRELVAAVLA